MNKFEYEARRQQIFGDRESHRQLSANNEQNPEHASGVDNNARPCEPAAGAGLLLTAETAVHGLLNLPEITDPGRWLKRHGAPVAINTGHSKRYLAEEIIAWAAKKFAASDASRNKLLALAAEKKLDQLGL